MYESVEKSSRETFGSRLKAARYQAGMDQADLAAALNVSLSAVQAWEQGTRMPRARMLQRIAAATGRPLSFLFGEAVS